jgi:DNA polymerase I-like protein with 3'-5' exonuclease and polymerase domains
VLLNIHDENVHCVPDAWVDTMATICYEEMNRNVGWSAGLPLASEVKVGANLADMEGWLPT